MIYDRKPIYQTRTHPLKQSGMPGQLKKIVIMIISTNLVCVLFGTVTLQLQRLSYILANLYSLHFLAILVLGTPELCY